MSEKTRHLLVLLKLILSYVLLSVMIRSLFGLEAKLLQSPGFLLLDLLTYLAGLASGMWATGWIFIIKEEREKL